MIGWRAYYADGRTYASDQGPWAHLPPDGIVGVVEFKEPPYRVIHDGYDWIWLDGGEIHTVTTHPDWGEWAAEPDVDCLACVKRGAAMEDKAWAAIQRRMLEDREVPVHG